MGENQDGSLNHNSSFSLPSTKPIAVHLSILHNGQQQYLAATDNSRRDLNQAVFDKIYLDDDEITNSQHKAVYHYLLDSNLPAVLENEAKRQQDTVTPDNTKNLRPMAGGSNVTLLVELRGFEPLTSSMPWKRATNCAIAPRAVPDYRMLSPVGKAALAACFRAVAMVSMAASSWATERNHASKADGGNATPPSSIAWKNRP